MHRTLALAGVAVALLPVVALRAAAQSAPAASTAPRTARPMTEQEYRDACAHRPGARARLYGCRPDPSARIPLVVIDGRPLPTDTVGPGRAAREAALASLPPGDIHEILIERPDTAIAVAGRGGLTVLRIRTRAAFVRDSLAGRPTPRR